jgi:hypothetical protein
MGLQLFSNGRKLAVYDVVQVLFETKHLSES